MLSIVGFLCFHMRLRHRQTNVVQHLFRRESFHVKKFQITDNIIQVLKYICPPYAILEAFL